MKSTKAIPFNGGVADRSAYVCETNDQSVLVSANIEHNLVVHEIDGPIPGADLRRPFPASMFDFLDPGDERLPGIAMGFPEDLQRPFLKDPHL